ncbi:hypothetical protein TNCT_117141 [Trichonephila clavata]|uniref:Ankyrin repeat protein n=2 Tax=Nephilidae TaxID=450948 RepID=A0A8X6EY31_TRICU|nr:hypothetical protein TNCT_334841 [Trichonephila clavata]GFR05510.1 hypothetical protein TNCT_117141 [Trichonephila clavata]GFT83254.1 hypothetical protein NPIL_40971 [Nephila pilipes]
MSNLDRVIIREALIGMVGSGLEEPDLEKLTEVAVKAEEGSLGREISEAERLEIRKGLEELLGLEVINSGKEIRTDNLDEEIAKQERVLGRKFSKEERLMDYFDRQVIVVEHLTGRKFSKEKRLEERLAIKANQDERIKKEADILQLHCAAYMGNLNMVKECIEKKGVDVNALARGNTALFCATQANHQHVTKYLIEKGASC